MTNKQLNPNDKNGAKYIFVGFFINDNLQNEHFT